MDNVKDVTDKNTNYFSMVFGNKDLKTSKGLKPILIQQREIELLNRIRLPL